MGVSLAVASMLVGCGSESGDGAVRVRLNGEEASRSGWPVAVGEETVAFADGWEVDFEHVVVSVRDFALEDADGDAAMLSTDPVVADLHRGTPDAWVFDGVPAQRWQRVSYRFAPPSAQARALTELPDGLVQRMADERLSLWLEGRATRDGTVHRFEWGLPLTVLNDTCVNGLDETDGLVVRANGFVEVELTVHLDHLFFDSLAEEPAMRFDPMAAVADDEGVVTWDALASQRLSDMRGVDGAPLRDATGSFVVYDPASHALEERNLQQFVLAAASTMGHFNGEGHCEYTWE